MDGENNGSKPYEQMDDLGGFPIFLETPIYKNGIPRICDFHNPQNSWWDFI